MSKIVIQALCLVLLFTNTPAIADVEPIRLNPENFKAELDRHRKADGSFEEGSLFLLAAGEYELEPTAYVDSTCGNCEDPDTPVQATLGLRISGKNILFQGEAPESTVIRTNAGYGLLVQDCEDCEIKGMTITGGVRDPDPNATDAGLVVQRSTARIAECLIIDNIGDADLIEKNTVGIIGIAGREGADMDIEFNAILRNSWDGIALYRGAEADITRNVIDGVGKAESAPENAGRGVAIGATWDAKAKITENTLRNYWKGVGVFVDARCIVRKNIIEKMQAWGIALWDAGKGAPSARIEGNIIYDTGACGISIARESAAGPDPGHCIYNVILRTGQNPKYDAADYYCVQCPIAVAARTDKFEIDGNIIYDNRRAPADAGAEYPDLDQETFRFSIGPLYSDLPPGNPDFFRKNYPKQRKEKPAEQGGGG